MTSTVDEEPPLLMRADEIVLIDQAHRHSGRSYSTLRRYAHDFGIARSVGKNGVLEFSLPALEMVLHRDMTALALLRRGDREHPRVRRYFEHLGLPT